MFNILDGSDHVYDSYSFVVSSAPDPDAGSAGGSWPLSFGILPPPSGSGSVLVRLRAFRAMFATAGTVGDGSLTLEPPEQVTIDRLVSLTFPSSGEQRVGITMAEDCMGTPARFAPSPSTCVDGSHPPEPPQTGVVTLGSDSPPSSVGSWAHAVETPCSVPTNADQLCIEGGFSILGDLADVGTTEADPILAPAPLRPVVLSPFLLDKYEFTVKRMRALIQSGKLAEQPLMVNDPTIAYSNECTWLGPTDASNDEKPVNCISYASAQAACKALGGDLPTEAQWEHAARGRGQRRTYPWGETFPQCCTSSLSRPGGQATQVECLTMGAGAEAVGSHPESASCAGGTGDVSRDGVYDLGGSLEEALSTTAASYGDACWGTGGVVYNPHCSTNTSPGARGSYWNAGLATAFGARRDRYGVSSVNGFRCAYPGVAK